MHLLRPARADRLLVVLSDIEMGAGGLVDDFPHTGFLCDLILSYTRPPYDDVPVTLVFNGDTFDFLKTSVDERYPVHVDATLALAKLARVATAHTDLFVALRQFLEGGRDRQIAFVVGNHDAELLFPEVQQAIVQRIGVSEGVSFPGLELRIGDAHIEHGAQDDRLFRIAPEAPFVRHQGKEILAMGWGAVALLEVAIPMQPLLCHHERLRPRRLLFDLIPELGDLVVDAYWRYWTRDWWRGFLDGDPVKQVSWTLFKEVVYRFGTRDPDVPRSDRFLRQIRQDERFRVYLVGHHHDAGWWSYGNRKVLQTGCLRNEFMLERGGEVQRPIPKVYAEVWQDEGRTVRSRLVEVDGPQPPPGYVPASIFDVLPQVRALLGTTQERQDAAEARRVQEAREAHVQPEER